MTTGVTANTWRQMIIDEGVAIVNYGEDGEFILGATNGGVSFGFETFTVRSPEIDGIKGRLAGVSRITEASPQIEVNLVDFSLDALALACPGSDIAEAGEIATISRSARVIPIEDYPINLAVVGKQSGTGNPVVALIKRPMMVSGFTIPTAPNSEATAQMTFVGHYDPDDPEAEPWEIRYPLSETTAILRKLVLAPDLEIVEDDVSGTVVSTIAGRASGSTIISTDARFEVVGNELRRSATGSLTAGTVTLTLVETLAGAGNSPMATGVTITVTAA